MESVQRQTAVRQEVYENNLLSEYHIRYGGYGGIAYHHVSDTYIALFTHFITCGVWEAVYILDGLLKNTSDIQPDTLHADTQGQSAPVFALSYLLGIQLMPRIRNWQDYTFNRPSPQEVYSYIDPLFKGVVDWKLIKTHWQDLMRVVLSIKAGKLMPSTILRGVGELQSEKSSVSSVSRTGTGGADKFSPAIYFGAGFATAFLLPVRTRWKITIAS